MRRALLVLAMVVATGCAASVRRTVPYVIGPTMASAPELLDAAIRASAEAGYDSPAVDAVRGSYVVRARAASPLLPVYFVVQCYADGWVRIIPAGPGAARTEGDIALPAAVHAEHVAHALALMRALRAPVDAEAP